MLQHLLLIWLSIFHPFYVSVTEVEQNQQSKTVQVSVRIFFDDLERAIGKQYKTKVNIIKPNNRKQTEEFIAAYVKGRLRIKANGAHLNLKFVGYEIEEEAAWCYFETEKLPVVKQLDIQNNILYEQHESQINMIHATVDGKRKSTKLDNPISAAVFSFN